MRGLNLEGSGKELVKFDQVRSHVGEQHSLNNDDVVLEMDKLRITPELNMEVPKMGTFVMTYWAKKQLGSILGVQWDKWFNPKHVDHKRIQEEIQHRFSKTGDTRKLRTRRFRSGSPGVEGCDGYLRAVLGPTYHPIDDDRVFDRLEKTYSSQIRELQFMPNHLSRKSSWGNDHCNHYTVIGNPINMGEINLSHPDKNVAQGYQLARNEGKLPDSDWIYPGFHIRNSEVGYTAIIIDEFSFRLVCLNGMMVTTGDSRLMYRQHRPIEDGVLDKQLGDVFQKVPHRWEHTRQKLNRMQETVVEEPAKIIDDTLAKMDAPKHFREAAIKAHEEEPLNTQYGVLQAVTRAAQEYDDMDRRFEFEAMAGRFMARA